MLEVCRAGQRLIARPYVWLLVPDMADACLTPHKPVPADAGKAASGARVSKNGQPLLLGAGGQPRRAPSAMRKRSYEETAAAVSRVESSCYCCQCLACQGSGACPSSALRALLLRRLAACVLCWACMQHLHPFVSFPLVRAHDGLASCAAYLHHNPAA